MPKPLTKEQMIQKALHIKKRMEFTYKYELAGQKHARIGEEEYVETRHGKIRVLKYGFEKNRIMPLYIDLHGGGFILMHADADEAMNLSFSEGADVKIVSIDYPKAPESPYPIGIEAIHDVISYFVTRSGQYRINPANLGIGGHSAGANMATVICMRNLKNKEFSLNYQVLDYPPLDLATSPYDKPKPKGCIPPRYATIFNACYIDPRKARNPYVSPVYSKAEDLKGMPQTLMIVCGGDSLHDEGVTYAGLLRSAGAEVEFHDYPAEKHGFTYYKPTENVKEAVRYMTEFIKSNAHKGSL